jgi:hypothetical protein
MEPGSPWKAWGPIFSAENLSFKSPMQNLREFPAVLANMLRDGSDRWALYGVGALAAAAIGLGMSARRSTRQDEGRMERWRIVGLALIALTLFVWLPFDVRGYMYYLNTRFAHLAAPLMVASIPPVATRFRSTLLTAAVACTLILGSTLSMGFAKFEAEAAALDALVARAAPRARVMGLIFNPSSKVVLHPVFLHSAAVIAQATGGIANFSFALTPHSPLRYRGEPPPTFPSEWRPDGFNPAREGPAYDHFLIRGARPEQALRGALDEGLVVAGKSADFWLVRRR